MSFDWAKYLQLAEILSEDENAHEAVYRTAISRAYYAAFCMSRNFARDKKEIVPRGDAGDHNFVIDHFIKSPDMNRFRIGKALNRMRQIRNIADYDDENVENPAQLAKVEIARAKTVLKLLTRL